MPLLVLNDYNRFNKVGPGTAVTILEWVIPTSQDLDCCRLADSVSSSAGICRNDALKGKNCVPVSPKIAVGKMLFISFLHRKKW